MESISTFTIQIFYCCILSYTIFLTFLQRHTRYFFFLSFFFFDDLLLFFCFLLLSCFFLFFVISLSTSPWSSRRCFFSRSKSSVWSRWRFLSMLRLTRSSASSLRSRLSSFGSTELSLEELPSSLEEDMSDDYNIYNYMMKIYIWCEIDEHITPYIALCCMHWLNFISTLHFVIKRAQQKIPGQHPYLECEVAAHPTPLTCTPTTTTRQIRHFCQYHNVRSCKHYFH